MKLNYLSKRKLHILYWFLYGLWFYGTNVLGNEELTLFTVVLSLPYFAFIFYTVLAILKRCFGRGQYLKGAALLLLFYVASAGLVYLLTQGPEGISLLYGAYIVDGYDFNWKEFIQTLLIMHGHFSILALLYYHYQATLTATKDRLHEAEMRLRAEDEKKEYEYTLLASQVSPHMLANIFQDWRQQFHKQWPDLALQVARMYDLMKFYMKAQEPEGPKIILLHDEVSAVCNFLEIQKQMVGPELFVAFSCTVNLMRYTIPPTSLLTLVENAMKHGNLSCREAPLRIELREETGGLSIKVANLKRGEESGVESHGLGLGNLRKRLEIIYGEAMTLRKVETKKYFEIQITIDYNIKQ